MAATAPHGSKAGRLIIDGKVVAESSATLGEPMRFQGFKCREIDFSEAFQLEISCNATIEFELGNGKTMAVAVHAFDVA